LHFFKRPARAVIQRWIWNTAIKPPSEARSPTPPASRERRRKIGEGRALQLSVCTVEVKRADRPAVFPSSPEAAGTPGARYSEGKLLATDKNDEAMER